jgi:hypothetical protein
VGDAQHLFAVGRLQHVEAWRITDEELAELE